MFFLPSLLAASLAWHAANEPSALSAAADSSALRLHGLEVDALQRSYHVHVPPNYRPDRPAPVVLVLHGAGINGPIMARFSRMNRQSDASGFLAVYPNGTGIAGKLLVFNSGSLPPVLEGSLADDVAYFRALLDDLQQHYAIDDRRIYAAGLSNGGMMCYRLALELSDRIAAIAAVAGTQSVEAAEGQPTRPVPILHLHGLSDWIVPYEGLWARPRAAPPLVRFQSVERTIANWVAINNCEEEPLVEPLPSRHADGTVVTRWTYPPRQGTAEVVLYRIAGGGHTWPGHPVPLFFLGRTTREIDANRVIWEFFERHSLPAEDAAAPGGTTPR